MSAQTITTPAGERLVLVSEDDFDRLVEAAMDNADRAAVTAFRQRFEAGEEELIPSEIVDRILSGESRIKVWWKFRGMTAASLAKAAGIGQGFLSQIETGKRDGTIDTLRKIATALRVTLDDIVAPGDNASDDGDSSKES